MAGAEWREIVFGHPILNGRLLRDGSGAKGCGEQQYDRQAGNDVVHLQDS